MSDVKKVLSGSGDYGFEDSIAREMANIAKDTIERVTDELYNDFSDIQNHLDTEFANMKNAFVYKDVNGSVIQVDDSATGKMSSFKMLVPPDRDGEGDPSSSNIRPFIAHNLGTKGTGVNVYIVNGNLFRITFDDQTTTNGITKVNNSDGSISFSGTATNSTAFQFNLGLFGIPPGSYQFYGMPELPEDSNITFRYRFNKNTIGGTLYKYFDFDGTIFTIDETTKFGVRAYLVIPAGTEVDIEVYPMIKLNGDVHKEFTFTDPNRYYTTFNSATSVSYISGQFELTDDPTVGKYTEFKRYTSYAGEPLLGKWVSDRDIYADGESPSIGADVIDMGDPSGKVTILTANNEHGVAPIYKDTYFYGQTGNYLIDAIYITNRTIDYISLNEIRYRSPLVESINMKKIASVSSYTDTIGRSYYSNGLAVTSQYIVLSLVSANTTSFPSVKNKFNAFIALDKSTLELANIPNNPRVIDVVNDLNLTYSHANNMTYVPSTNEIYVRTGRSRKAIVLDGDTIEVKRIETMPHNGGCAYDPITDQWAFLATTADKVSSVTITNGTKDTILYRVTCNNQGTIQGIGFYDGIIFIPASPDSNAKGNNIVAVNTDGVVVADWWFDGGGEFEDVDVMDNFRLVLLSNNNGYHVYSGIYKPFNAKVADIKAYDLYKTSTITD